MIIVKVQVEAIFSDIDYNTSSLVETVVGEDKEKCIQHAYEEIQNKAWVFMVVSNEANIQTYRAEMIDGVYKPTESISLETRKLDFC